MSFRNCLTKIFVSSSFARVNHVFFSSVASSQIYLQRSFPSKIPPLVKKINYIPQEGFGTLVSESTVITERIHQYHVMTIGINRPHVRNAVNCATAQALSDAFTEFEEDDEMYVAILHGLGGNFSSGIDLEELVTPEIKEPYFGVYGGERTSQHFFSKPVIAAINGYAVAGGLELALMCDLRVVEESAKMGVLSRRFGVPLIDGGTVRLPELIGLSRALDLILTGRTIGSKEAYDFGIANRISQDGNCFGMALKLAQELIKYPQMCLNADRRSTYFSSYSSSNFEESMSYERYHGLQSPILEKCRQEAMKFGNLGLGKGGKYNVNPPVSPETWELEFDKMKNISDDIKK